MNAYERLKNDLISGELNLTHIDIAVMEWIKQRKEIPEGVRNLLVQEGGGGLVRSLFSQIGQTIGTMELSYRRGVQEGQEEKKMP